MFQNNLNDYVSLSNIIFLLRYINTTKSQQRWGCRDRDRMVVGFTITYEMQSVPITTNLVSSNPTQEMDNSIQHHVIKFVTDLPQVGGFLLVLPPVSSINKTDRHDITEILLNVALKTTNQIKFKQRSLLLSITLSTILSLEAPNNVVICNQNKRTNRK